MVNVSAKRLATTVLGITLSWVGSAQAQGAPAPEIAVSYSYLRADPGDAMFAGQPIELENENLHGVDVTATGFVNGRLGFDFAFGVYNGSISIPDVVTIPGQSLPEADFKQVVLLGGPRVRLVSNRKVTVSVRALVGAADGNTDLQVGITGVGVNNVVFAASFGGSVTISLSEALAYRVAQPEVYITNFGDATQTNFRVATGIVFRYGS